MSTVFVDRRFIRYDPPFNVQTFSGGLSIGVDAIGRNCVRWSHKPSACGTYDAEALNRACSALNSQPIADVIEVDWPL